MYRFSKIEVEIISNRKNFSFLDSLKTKWKEWLIKKLLTNKEADGYSIEKVINKVLLKKDSEYLHHLDIFPLKFEVRDKKLDKKHKHKHYIPRLTILIKYELK